jgi:hypothetical protein
VALSSTSEMFVQSASGENGQFHTVGSGSLAKGPPAKELHGANRQYQPRLNEAFRNTF